MMTYLRDPDAIYALSFATIRAEAELGHLSKDAEPLAVRIIHACGMVDIANDLVVSESFVSEASSALAAGKPILVDVEMVRHGIIARKLKGSEVICTLNDPRARDLGVAQKITRSAAAVSLWRENLAGSIVVIGNAPTALFALLEMIAQGAPRPAAIVGIPVGFVGAIESKEALISHAEEIPFVTVRGRRGGSAMAASAINALSDCLS